MVRLFVTPAKPGHVVANVSSGTRKPPHRLNSLQINPRQTHFPMMKQPMAPKNLRKKELKLWKLVQLAPKAKMLRWTALRNLLRQKRKWTTMMLQARSADLYTKNFQKI